MAGEERLPHARLELGHEVAVGLLFTHRFAGGVAIGDHETHQRAGGPGTHHLSLAVALQLVELFDGGGKPRNAAILAGAFHHLDMQDLVSRHHYMPAIGAAALCVAGMCLEERILNRTAPLIDMDAEPPFAALNLPLARH